MLTLISFQEFPSDLMNFNIGHIFIKPISFITPRANNLEKGFNTHTNELPELIRVSLTFSNVF